MGRARGKQANEIRVRARWQHANYFVGRQKFIVQIKKNSHTHTERKKERDRETATTSRTTTTIIITMPQIHLAASGQILVIFIIWQKVQKKLN